MALVQDIKQLLSILKLDKSLTSNTLLEVSDILEKLDEIASEIDWKRTVEGLISILFQIQIQKNIRRCFKKILHNARLQSPAEVDEILSKQFQEIFAIGSLDDGTYSSISFLLEDCGFSRKLLSPHFEKIVDGISTTLDEVVPSQEGKIENDKLYQATKLFVQILQFMNEDVSKSITDKCLPVHDCFRRIARISLEVLMKNQMFSNSVRDLCSVVIGNMLNYSENDETVALTMFHLCGEYHEDDGKLVSIISHESLQEFHTLPIELQRVYIILLLRGIYSCVRPVAFAIRIGNTGSPTFFHFSFKKIREALDVHGEAQYHTFHVFKLWWESIHKICKMLCRPEYVLQELNCNDSIFVNGSLKILLQHWDNPISGVPSLVVEIFEILIDVQLLCKKQKEIIVEENDFISHLIHDLMQLPSSVKGKYKFLTVLVQKVGSTFVLQHCQGLVKSMVHLLAVNHLFPVVSKLYQAIVLKFDVESCSDKNCASWSETFAPSLVSALTDSNSVTRMNAIRMWLPVHFKVLPDAYKTLTDVVRHCKNEKNAKFLQLALIGIAKGARKEKLISVEDVDLAMLESSLCSFDDDVRSEAFSLLCCHDKLSDMISSSEFTLLEKHLPLNMNSDSPYFRQQLVFCIKKFLERIRDSLGIVLRKKRNVISETSESYKDACINFLNFIANLCTESLHVSSTYQRKKTVLDLFSMLLTTYPIQCSLSSTDIPFCIVDGKALQLIITQDHRSILCDILYDRVPEIRELSLKLLQKYFRHHDEVLDKAMLHAAVGLCRSPKSQDAESGAIIYEYMISGVTIVNAELSQTDGEGLSSHPNTLNVLSNMVTNFLDDSEKFIENVIVGSRHSPVHGWMLSLNRCMRSQAFNHAIKSVDDSHCLFKMLSTINECTCDVINFALNKVFGSSMNFHGNEQSELGASADFSEMTIRIKNLIIDKKQDKEAATEDILLTHDQEKILAACWLCLLHGCALLSTTCKTLLNLEKHEASSADPVRHICQVFVSVLTCCRHRGVIEGCYESFLATCKILLSSEHTKYQVIPKEILLVTTRQLKLEYHSSSNTTRRSAGIPLIIEAILVAEVTCGGDELFNKTMTDMVDLSKSAASLSHAVHVENCDYPQVHGIYVLKQLFHNTHLGSVVMKFLEEAFQIAVECASSELWVVRNAAIHLFGAVASRVLGQKNVDGAHIKAIENSVASSDFFSCYPKLSVFIVNIIKKSLKEDISGNKNLNFASKLASPGLHPVLSVLSKLTYKRQNSECIPSELPILVEYLLSCPNYSIRCLAAQALFGLVSRDESMELALKFLEKLSQYQGLRDFNSVHGHLVFVSLLAQDSNVDKPVLLNKILQNSWALQVDKGIHPVIFQTYSEVLIFIKDTSSQSKQYVAAAVKQELAVFVSTRNTPKASTYLYHIGSDKFLELLAEEDVLPILEQCLFSNIPRCQQVALSYINSSAGGNSVLENMVNRFLLQSIAKDGMVTCSHKVLNKCFECWLGTSHENLDLDNLAKLSQLCKNILCSDAYPLSLLCSALQAFALIIEQFISKYLSEKSCCLAIRAWCQSITTRTSRSKASEPLRKSASLSLEKAGHVIMDHIFINYDMYDHVVGEMICAVLSILQDEQPNIREPACCFVSRLCNGSTGNPNIVHQNTAVQMFLQYIFKRFRAEVNVLNPVFQYCFEEESIKDIFSRNDRQDALFEEEPFNLFKEPVELAQATSQLYLETIKKGFGKDLRVWLRNLAYRIVSKIGPLPKQGRSNYVNLSRLLIFLKMLLQAIDDELDHEKQQILRKILKNVNNPLLKKKITSVLSLTPRKL